MDRLAQGEFFDPVEGKFSVAAIMKACGRTKQEARTDIAKYENHRDSGGGAGNERLEQGLITSVRPLPQHDDRIDPGQLARPPDIADRPAPPETKPRTPWSEIISRAIGFVAEKSIALMVGTLGGWLAYIQLGINYDFWRSQGQSLGAQDQFGYVGIIIEVLLNTLLPARRILETRSERFWSCVAIVAMVFCLAASTYASWNFAARNIDDGAQRRATAATDIAKLEQERDDLAKLQIVHLRDGRLNAARADADQIQIREAQIKELTPKAGTTAPDVFNVVGKVFYTCIPTLSGILIMIAFVGLARRRPERT